jgi:hypothetical protein
MSSRTRWLITERTLAVLAVASGALALYAAASATGDRSWPTAPGKVLSSHFAGLMSGAPPSKYGASARGGVLYRWQVAYEYEVAGQRHRGEAIASYTPTAGTLKVYYNPVNPGISTLEPGIDPFVVTSFSVLAGVLFLASRFAHGAASAG